MRVRYEFEKIRKAQPKPSQAHQEPQLDTPREEYQVGGLPTTTGGAE